MTSGASILHLGASTWPREDLQPDQPRQTDGALAAVQTVLEGAANPFDWLAVCGDDVRPGEFGAIPCNPMLAALRTSTEPELQLFTDDLAVFRTKVWTKAGRAGQHRCWNPVLIWTPLNPTEEAGGPEPLSSLGYHYIVFLLEVSVTSGRANF